MSAASKDTPTAAKTANTSKVNDMATKMNPAFAAMIEKKKASAAGKKPAGKPFAKGGSIDGIATKGKTKGTMITMKKGGKAAC